jgi:hypothetical protein
VVTIHRHRDKNSLADDLQHRTLSEVEVRFRAAAGLQKSNQGSLETKLV